MNDFFMLVDVIGAMMSRADYNLGEVRVLAYWLRNTITTLDPEVTENTTNIFTFNDTDRYPSDLFF
ncbi:MAG: hypothetical protein H6925_04555 [Holosporaceae bacterium]|nr:MAG: hypothetical protein H6925_04555 [Holosporaceae bacterium]